MGNHQATIAMDIGAVDPTTEDTGSVHVSCLDADMQLLDALIDFYGRLPRQRRAFIELLVDALRTLRRVFPIEDIAVETSTDQQRHPLGVRWRWSDAASAEHWPISQASDELPAPGAWLLVLERIGQAILQGDAYFADQQVSHWSPEQYALWSVGSATTEKVRPVPTTRRARGPSVVTDLFPLLACHRRISGMAGAYWLLPMMFAMLRAAPAHVLAVPVPCPPASGGKALCRGLPAGCQVRYHWWPAGGWRSHARLVAFLMYHQCETITGEFGTWRRMRDGPRTDHYFPVDADADALLLVTVGGVPIATAGVQPCGDQASWYVSALCAVTRSGGGTLAVRHLQATARTLRLDAVGDAVSFYARLGFTRSNPDPVYQSMQWTAA